LSVVVVNEEIARGPAVQRDARHAMADAGDWHNADDVPDDDELLEPWQRVMRENARKAKVERFVELLRVRVDPDRSIDRSRVVVKSRRRSPFSLSLVAPSFSRLLPFIDHVARCDCRGS
jgi:hypothetical protein